MILPQNEKLRRTLSSAQADAYLIGRKLESFGVLLRKQGENCEGLVELYGLGVVLTGLSEELSELSDTLDQVGLKLAKQEHGSEQGGPI